MENFSVTQIIPFSALNALVLKLNDPIFIILFYSDKKYTLYSVYFIFKFW